MTLLHYFFDLTSFYRQKYRNIFVRILVRMKTLKSTLRLTNLYHTASKKFYVDENREDLLGRTLMLFFGAYFHLIINLGNIDLSNLNFFNRTPSRLEAYLVYMHSAHPKTQRIN